MSVRISQIWPGLGAARAADRAWPGWVPVGISGESTAVWSGEGSGGARGRLAPGSRAPAGVGAGGERCEGEKRREVGEEAGTRQEAGVSVYLYFLLSPNIEYSLSLVKKYNSAFEKKSHNTYNYIGWISTIYLVKQSDLICMRKLTAYESFYTTTNLSEKN